MARVSWLGLSRRRSTKGAQRIIFSNSKAKLLRVLSGSERKTRLLILEPVNEGPGIEEYLRLTTDCEVIDRGDAIKSFRPGFKSKYIELLSEINRHNHSAFWWGFYLTRKDSLYTNLSQNIFYCCLIGNLMKKDPSTDLVIVTEDRDLIKQAGDWARTQGLETI